MKLLKLAGCLACLFGLLVFSSLPCSAAVSASIPLDSWVYPALDKLTGLGLIDSSLQGARPYTRLETVRQLTEARSRAAESAVPPVAGELLRRLETEFSDELAAAGGEFPWLKPLRELRLDYLYQDGQESAFPGTDGRQFALNTNNFGIEYANRHNGQVVFESEARLGRYALLNLRPLLQYRETAGDSLRLLHGTAAVGLGPVELSAGRQSLWWGQGRHGSLVLTSNARPLDMVRLTNPKPATLPWIFRYLGPFRFDLFVSRLEHDRVVPEPYFSGLRINIKPVSWFELGGSRTVLFGGKGRPAVGFDDFLTIVGGNNLGGDEDTSNQLAAFDFRLRLATLWGAELYGEMGGEDEADLLGFIPFIAKKAVLGGLYLPRLEPTGRLSLRLEYTDLNYEGQGRVWYRHSIYRSGYVFKETLLGHHAGGDATDLFVELKAFLPLDVTLTAAFDVERRGESQPVQEKHAMPSLDLEWVASPGLTLHAGYSFDRVKNFAFVAGEDRDFHFGRAGVRWNW